MDKGIVIILVVIGGFLLLGHNGDKLTGLPGVGKLASSGQGGSLSSRTDTGRPAQPGDQKKAVYHGKYTMCSDQSPDIALSCTGTIIRSRQVPQGAPTPYPPRLQPSADGKFSGYQLDHHCRDIAVRTGRSAENRDELCTQAEAEEQARQNPGRHLEVEQGTPNAQGLILAVDNRWFRADGHRVDPITGWRFSNHPAGRQPMHGQLHATREWTSYALYLACSELTYREGKAFDRDNPPCTQEEALAEINRNPTRYRNYKTRWDKSKEKLNYLEEDWREK